MQRPVRSPLLSGRVSLATWPVNVFQLSHITEWGKGGDTFGLGSETVVRRHTVRLVQGLMLFWSWELNIASDSVQNLGWPSHSVTSTYRSGTDQRNIGAKPKHIFLPCSASFFLFLCFFSVSCLTLMPWMMYSCSLALIPGGCDVVCVVIVPPAHSKLHIASFRCGTICSRP